MALMHQAHEGHDSLLAQRQEESVQMQEAVQALRQGHEKFLTQHQEEGAQMQQTVASQQIPRIIRYTIIISLSLSIYIYIYIYMII